MQDEINFTFKQLIINIYDQDDAYPLFRIYLYIYIYSIMIFIFSIIESYLFNFNVFKNKHKCQLIK